METPSKTSERTTTSKDSGKAKKSTKKDRRNSDDDVSDSSDESGSTSRRRRHRKNGKSATRRRRGTKRNPTPIPTLGRFRHRITAPISTTSIKEERPQKESKNSTDRRLKSPLLRWNPGKTTSSPRQDNKASCVSTATIVVVNNSDDPIILDGSTAQFEGDVVKLYSTSAVDVNAQGGQRFQHSAEPSSAWCRLQGDIGRTCQGRRCDSTMVLTSPVHSRRIDTRRHCRWPGRCRCNRIQRSKCPRRNRR